MKCFLLIILLGFGGLQAKEKKLLKDLDELGKLCQDTGTLRRTIYPRDIVFNCSYKLEEHRATSSKLSDANLSDALYIRYYKMLSSLSANNFFIAKKYRDEFTILNRRIRFEVQEDWVRTVSKFMGKFQIGPLNCQEILKLEQDNVHDVCISYSEAHRKQLAEEEKRTFYKIYRAIVEWEETFGKD